MRLLRPLCSRTRGRTPGVARVWPPVIRHERQRARGPGIARGASGTRHASPPASKDKELCCLMNTLHPVPLTDTLSHRPRNSGEDSRGSEGGGDPAGRHIVWTCCLIATLFTEQVTVTRPGSAGATCQVSDWSRRPKVTSTPDLGRLHGFCSLGQGRQRCRGSVRRQATRMSPRQRPFTWEVLLRPPPQTRDW